MFLLWFSSLEGKTADRYDGMRDGQSEIPNADIMAIGHEHYSPAKVNDRLTKVEVQLKTAWRTGATLLVGVLLLLGGVFLQQCNSDVPTQVVETPAPRIVSPSSDSPSPRESPT